MVARESENERHSKGGVGGDMPAYSMGGASASWQMFPARPWRTSSVSYSDEN